MLSNAYIVHSPDGDIPGCQEPGKKSNLVHSGLRWAFALPKQVILRLFMKENPVHTLTNMQREKLSSSAVMVRMSVTNL